MSGKIEWAWTSQGGDRALVPFSDRRDAWNDALLSGHNPVEIGQIERIDPADYVDVDLGTMIRSIEERARDQGGWPGDDELIRERARHKTGTDAAEQLALVLQEWASLWLTPVAWRLADGAETVVFTDDDEVQT